MRSSALMTRTATRPQLFAQAGRRSFAKAGLTKPNIGIAGATGAVGKEIMGCIEKLDFPYSDIKMWAHPDEAGGTIDFMGKTYTLEAIGDGCFDDVDIALFSAGGDISKNFAPVAAAAGCVVVDNSSEFRMDPNCPLVVPEVNGHAVAGHNGIIANPNCTTILMNVPVYPLHKEFGVKRVVASTYQAASGAGLDAMKELEQQARDWVASPGVGGEVDGKLTQDIFGRQYIWNLFSHNSDIYLDSGYNEEEYKMVIETPKIFEEVSAREGGTCPAVSVTCVRVPVLRAHTESLNLQFSRKVTVEEVTECLRNAPGITVCDDRANNQHPEPMKASFEYDILVGRIREDLGQEPGYGIEMLISGDQLLKGAALNAVQIAELLLKK